MQPLVLQHNRILDEDPLVVSRKFTQETLYGFFDEYAKLVAGGRNYRIAALLVLGNDHYMAEDWIKNPIVKALIHEYSFDNSKIDPNQLFSRDAYTMQLQREMLNNDTPVETRYKFYHLYAEVRGFRAMGNGGNGGGGIVNNGVMVFKDNGTDEEWEIGLRNQQAELIASVKDRN